MQGHVRGRLPIARLWPEDGRFHSTSIHHQSIMVDR
jgi:hypothetical protein